MSGRIGACLLLVGLLFPCAANATPAQFDRTKVLQALESAVRDNYLDAQLADKLALELKAHQPELVKITDRAAFAVAVTNLLQARARDVHLRLLAQPDALPELAATPQAAAQMESARNYGITTVGILPGNIGYLAFSGFAQFTPAVSQRLAWAFDLLSDTNGLIIDLTKSRGGDPATEAAIVGYLTRPGILLDAAIGRDGKTLETSRTPDGQPGAAYGSKRPVGVAVSAKTISAAEALAYDLQALGRAQIVGEVTRGGANPSRFMALADGFIVLVPVARTINALDSGKLGAKGRFAGCAYLNGECCRDSTQGNAPKAPGRRNRPCPKDDSREGAGSDLVRHSQPRYAPARVSQEVLILRSGSAMTMTTLAN